MPITEHTPFIEDIPAYVLGALDAKDISALETHLTTCASCRTVLAEYRSLSASLLMTILPKQPSAALRKRLQSRLPSAQKNVHPHFSWSFSQLAMGMAIVLLLMLNTYSILQMQSVQRQQTQLARQLQTSQTVLAMLSYPGTQTISINAGAVTGTLLLDKDRNVATLVLWNMPPLTEKQSYQMWLIDSQGDRTSAGIFRPENEQRFTSASITSQVNMSNFVGLGVTVEPAGGSDHPTGTRIFKVDF